jgi:hypothetical protein
LIAVPKTQKGPRLIAAEPVAHQWIQQLVKNQLEARLADTPLKNCISFRDQSPNGKLAMQGSKDGSFATIDLSSASDRLSLRTVERAFRSNLTILTALHACRTRWLSYRSEDEEFFLKLNKFAPMGSAVTFPVQSIIYAMIAITAIILDSGKTVTSSSIEWASHQVRVFGDDIIVPTHACKLTIKLLQEQGLVVNTDKTFYTGRFRESCGVDAFMGHDVTPPYILEYDGLDQPGKIASLVKTRNNFYLKGYWHTAYWLQSLVPSVARLLPDIPACRDAFGISSCLGEDTHHLRRRYNEALHRYEVKTFILVAKKKTVAPEGYSRLLQWFIEKPRADILWDGGQVVKSDVYSRLGWKYEGSISETPSHWSPATSTS